MASERVSSETVSRAVDALLKWRKSRLETEKPKLFDQDEEFLYLILSLKKIPQNDRVNPYKVPVPHCLLSPASENCLIIDDRAKTLRITKNDAQNKIKSDSIPISKVLKLSKLTSDYRPFEAKRKLCSSYDLFFADKAIVPLLPRLLGKQFFKKRKLPVPIDLKKKNWKEQVESAGSSALLFLRTGTCSVLKVAKMSMERDEIVENVIAAIRGVVEIVPNKWMNVRSFHVKLLDSVTLPIYQVVPDVRLKIEGVRDLEEAMMVNDEKSGKKKKGRIHEIKYMDDKMSEDGDDHNEVDDDYENGKKGSGGLVSKKRKKGIKVKTVDSSELGSVKPLKESSKRMKKDGDDYENGEKASGGLVSKTKKGIKVNTKMVDLSEGSVKQLKESTKKRKEKDGLSSKADEDVLIMKSKNKLSFEDDDCLGKKKRVDGKVKAKKSKKAA